MYAIIAENVTTMHSRLQLRCLPVLIADAKCSLVRIRRCAWLAVESALNGFEKKGVLSKLRFDAVKSSYAASV